MIQVTIGSNTTRKKVTISAETTLRTALEDNEIDYTAGTIHLDGCPLEVGDMDKTFAELGITANCYLISVVKVENA